MRKLLLPGLALLFACSGTNTPPMQTAPAPPAVYGMTPAEEGKILALEDRREFDPQTAASWIAHPNALHRRRMALALGRIGPQTFADANHNGLRDAGEHQAGVDLLVRLVADPDREVRQTAAFSLGEIGDAAAADALVELARDADASVAGEAVEALSKLAPQLALDRYRPFTSDARPGVRVRAIRFLIRFNSDEASALALASLDAVDPAVREAAAYALSRRAYPPARPALELLLNDPSMMTRTYAAAALGRIAAAESFIPLVALLRDSYPWVRTNALVALAKIVAKNPHAIEGPASSQDALRIVDLADDPDPGTRASAVPLLGEYAVRNEVAKNRLRELMTGGSRWDRELAAGVWARHFFTATGAMAIPTAAWERVRVLEAVADTDAGAALRRELAGESDPLVRSNAIGSIPDNRAGAELDVIRKAMEDPDVIVRANAIDRYGKSGRAEVATLLAAEQRGRKDAMDDARLSAIGVLSETDYPGREAFLRSLLSDHDPVVRRVAADAIEQKLKLPRPQYTPLPAERPAADYEEVAAWSRQPHSATIRTARGSIRIALLTQEAPMTTWNFAALARRGYFDNTSFMRVVPNFVIQGGDPRNDMSGGPGYAIRDEINLQKYTRGAVGMALSGPDTGGSQFFITHSPQPHLDGGYTIFGRVVGGLGAVVDQIERGDRVETIVIDAPADKETR